MDADRLLDFVWVIPAVPFAGALVLLFFGKRIGEPIAGWIGSATVGIAFVLSVVTFFELRSLENSSHVTELFTWIPAGGFGVSFGLLVDPLSVTYIVFVTGVAFLIHLFAIGYMHGDPRFSRFFAFTNLFVAAMLVLVLGSGFLLTFLGWEGVGVCSYLLVGFWFERGRASVAAKKAFVTNRVGDFGFMVAMFLIFATLGSLDYAAMDAVPGIARGTATAIALLLFLAAIGKSAQFPLHVWLPDAMEGPTPVSALIHAATMVTAGVYLIARTHPFFERSGTAMDVVAWVGAGTALFAATIALVQPDIKRVLAYSTVSQLGYMFLALGVGAYSAAIFMVIMHAFFKGTLFMGAGSVIHGNGETQDLRVMGGLRKFMPLTAIAFILAWLAIAGIPPFSGFWAKDGVLEQAYLTHNYGVWIVGLLAAVLTAFYMTREVWLVFFGNERFHRPADVAAREHDITASPTVDYGDPVPVAPLAADREPRESPPIMTIPLFLLAALAVIGGVINLPFTQFENLHKWLEPVFEGVPQAHPRSFGQAAGLDTISVLLALGGIFLAFALYKRGLERTDHDPANERLGIAGRFFGKAWFVDEGLSRAVDGPVRTSATWLSEVFDTKIIDGAVNGVGWIILWCGAQFRRVQTGYVRQYALGIVLGTVLIIAWFVARA
jgi:NADH-quinone oxidoreductase subunit L